MLPVRNVATSIADMSIRFLSKLIYGTFFVCVLLKAGVRSAWGQG